jgi:hypothetical protein
MLLSPQVDADGKRWTALRIFYQLPSRDFSALLARLALRSILWVRDKSISPPKKLNQQPTETPKRSSS